MKSVWRIIESDNLGRADNGAVDVGPNHTIPYYYVGPNRPLFAELLPCAVSTTCSALSLVNRLLGMPGLRPSRWWWQEVFKRKYSIVHIMSENGLNVIDLVLTHLNHPWGPPWTLETLGDLWRPLATMPENSHFGQNFLCNIPLANQLYSSVHQLSFSPCCQVGVNQEEVVGKINVASGRVLLSPHHNLSLRQSPWSLNTNPHNMQICNNCNMKH